MGIVGEMIMRFLVDFYLRGINCKPLGNKVFKGANHLKDQ
jgi:hypothetical protein